MTREEKLEDLLTMALPYLEDAQEFHEEVTSDSGKARFRKLVREIRTELGLSVPERFNNTVERNYESLESAKRHYRIDQDGGRYTVRWWVTDTDGTDKLVIVFWSPSLERAEQFAHRRLVRMGIVEAAS